MNMVSLPRPACPYCTQSLVMWPRATPFYHCHKCQRPLARYPLQRSPRIYRIFSVIAAAKGITAATGALALFAMIALHMPLPGLGIAVAIQLAIYGATDITDGVLGLGSNVDRSARSVRVGSSARRWAWAKIVFGATNCALAAFGFLVVEASS
jgi:hypothetical protein